MARFYGTVRGGRGEATRLGHPSSGLRVTAQSFSGDVVVELSVVDDEDHVVIYARGHGGAGAGVTLYSGPVKTLRDQTAFQSLVSSMVGERLAA